MKTYFEAVIAGEDKEYAGQAAGAVFKEIDRIESLFSRFDSTSEISRINRLKPGESLLIGVETYECLSIAERVRIETGGAFDINIRSCRQHMNFAHAKEQGLPSEKNLSEMRSGATGFSGFELIKTPAGFELGRTSEDGGGMQSLDLDLGGIGKGYSLDRGLCVLADWGISRALLHAGTSTAVSLGSAPEPVLDERRGPAEAGAHLNSEAKEVERPADYTPAKIMDVEGWPVGVGGARPCPGSPTRVLLKSRALSGSGTEVKGQHILDPRTGLPAGGHPAAWASHPTAAESDALSTAFMVMGTEDVEEYCRCHPDVWALVFLFDGTCRVFNPHLIGDVPKRDTLD